MSKISNTEEKIVNNFEWKNKKIITDSIVAFFLKK